ncbi:MAG: hypothetical protein ABS938_18315 [Psychrobacillus psychrodurans]
MLTTTMMEKVSTYFMRPMVNVIRSYTYSVLGPLSSMKKGNQTFFYHYNAHGDVIALTDESGQVVSSYEDDAWGERNYRRRIGAG